MYTRHVCLFIKKKCVPLAEASPSAFTSVIWSCCIPSSSITATEKPTDVHDTESDSVIILFFHFETSQFDSVHCCSITAEQLDPLKAKCTHIRSPFFGH